MSNLRKIIAWIFAFAIIIYGLFVPVFASVNPDSTDSRGNFYDWVVNQGGSFGGGRPDDSIGGGRYSKDHYDDFVSELPATGITSGGHIIWQSTFDSLVGTGDIYTNSASGWFSSNSAPGYWSSLSRLYVEKGFDCIQFSFLDNANVKSFLFKFRIIFPMSGYYRVLPGKAILFRVVSDSGDIINTEYNYTLGTSFSHCDVGVYETPFVGGVTNTSSSGFRAWAYSPRYEIIPDTSLDTSAGSQYSVTTRPTSITGGNYGIVGDNGTINTVTNNNQIINETNNTYYNPATGQTSTISDWSYNYEDRSYTLTLESGDTTTVTYGDENISIIENNVVEGDTIINNYTIYYMIDGSGSDNPSPAPSICPHSWQESSRTEPACTSPGKVVYVCSQCGQTKSETLKALGHDWQVERTVQTLYDENGNVTQQGYTIYQCSICGEQYKDADSTGPPDNTVNDGGLIEWLNGLIKHLSDNLSGAVDLILSFFQEIPKLFGGFLDFLSAMFPYLPDDIIFLLTFGIAALVFVGVIKAIRR